MLSPFEAVPREMYEGADGAARQGARPPEGYAGVSTQALIDEMAARMLALRNEQANREADEQQRPTVSLWKFVNEIPLAERQANPDKPYLWNWDPAFAALKTYVQDNAGLKSNADAATGTARYDGLPTIHIKRWRYRATKKFRIEGWHGWRIYGDGEEATMIRYEGDGEFFEIHRSSKGAIDLLGGECFVDGIPAFDPAAGTGSGFKGLRQNSCFVRLWERNDDPNPAMGNTLRIAFTRVSVQGFHYGYKLEGNQQLDDIAWFKPRMRDNFIDWYSANSQAVNQQIYAGERVAWVNFDIREYQNRLSTWAGVPWHNASSGRATWEPYDGATFWIKAGGQIGVFGGSDISLKAFVHFDEITAADDVGLGDPASSFTTLGVHVWNGRWEMRKRDPNPPTVKGRAQHRISMLRYTNPSPPDAAGVFRMRVDASFEYCKWNMQDGSAAAPLRLFQLANFVSVRVNCVGEAILNPDRASVAGYINNNTQIRPARFEAVMPIIAHERLTTSDWTLDNSQGAGAIFVGHLVYMEDSRSLPLDGSVPTRYRSLSWARLLSKGDTMSLGSQYGILPGTGGYASAARTYQLGGNAKLFRITASQQGSGDATTLAWDITYTNAFGQTITRRLSLAQSGNLPRVSAITLNDFVSNGALTITPIAPGGTAGAITATAVQGSLDLEVA